MRRILLVASSIVVEGYDRGIRLPNIGLSSIAANLDSDFSDIKILDLVQSRRNPQKAFLKTIQTYKPDIVGFSSMTFQYAEILKLARLSKEYLPEVPVVVGGYHPTVNYEEMTADKTTWDSIDYIIRSEGEIAFNKLLWALEGKVSFTDVPNLCYRENGKVKVNPLGKLLKLDKLKPPKRDARIYQKGFHILGYPAEIIETSRGCTQTCNFCSISVMYGRSFRTYTIERVINDIRDAVKHGAKTILFADDNITLSGNRFKALCRAIIDAKLEHIRYICQASVQGLKKTPGLAELMVEAGFKWIQLGIENTLDEALDFFNKSNQLTVDDAFEVISKLKELGVKVYASIIIGNPEDSEQTIQKNFHLLMTLKPELLFIGILTPYPSTPIREELLERGLVTNEFDYTKYDMFHANVRTKYLSSAELVKIRDHFAFRYPLESGTLWKLLNTAKPLFIIKVLISEMFTNPADFFGYLRGLKKLFGRRSKNGKK